MAFEMEAAVLGASLVILLAGGPFILKHCMRQRRRVHVGGVELQSR